MRTAALRHAEEAPLVKRRLGRPPKDPAERRTERVDVFFSPAERAKLAEDASACGVTPAAYIRRLVAGSRPAPPSERATDPRLLLELNAIGNNLRQALGFVDRSAPARADWESLDRLLRRTLSKAALTPVSVSPRLLVRLNAAGTLLNRAVADRHAGSRRRHDWRSLRSGLTELLEAVAAIDSEAGDVR